MVDNRPALIVFQGGILHSESSLEAMVAATQAAATLDLLSLAAKSGVFDLLVLVTELPSLASEVAQEAARWPGDSRLEVIAHGRQGRAPFHFGESLRAICEERKLERVVYVGGGAMPLASETDLRNLALAVSGHGECVVANNLFSADAVAFYPTSTLTHIAPPAADNDLAWLLHFRAGLPFAPLPRSISNQFDIDTPTDLATIWWSSQEPPLKALAGAHLREILARVPEQLPRLASAVERAYQVMATRRAEIFVAGRVSSWVWRRLETNLPCQTRIISEERGMRAGGRDERGEARSLLGLYADAVGVRGLIQAIEQTCNAAFLDTRVLFAHRALKPSPQERFASDALMPEAVGDPWIRELTEAAAASQVPIVMGGHSLVSGGVWALSERVWAGGSIAR